jgi:hypothetical protein
MDSRLRGNDGSEFHPTKKRLAALVCLLHDAMAERTGLEPATLGVTGRHVNQAANQLNCRCAAKPRGMGIKPNKKAPCGACLFAA